MCPTLVLEVLVFIRKIKLPRIVKRTAPYLGIMPPYWKVIRTSGARCSGDRALCDQRLATGVSRNMEYREASARASLKIAVSFGERGSNLLRYMTAVDKTKPKREEHLIICACHLKKLRGRNSN